MKEKQTEEEKKPSRDQGVNTEETMMTNINENEQKQETLQSGSGLLYVGNRKRKAASPPGMRPPQKKRKTMWLTFKQLNDGDNFIFLNCQSFTKNKQINKNWMKITHF